MENSFNVNEWLPEDERAIPKEAVAFLNGESFNIEWDIEKVTLEIEATRTDITDTYQNWIQIGFGLANELGEMGRSYFHRISRYYPKYSYAATDKQYDSCVKGGSGKTTIKTFFFLAKQAGIDISNKLPGGQLEKKRN